MACGRQPHCGQRAGRLYLCKPSMWPTVDRGQEDFTYVNIANSPHCGQRERRRRGPQWVPTASAVGCPLAVSDRTVEQGEDTCRMCCPVRSTLLQSYLAETALMPVHLKYMCPEAAASCLEARDCHLLCAAEVVDGVPARLVASNV